MLAIKVKWLEGTKYEGLWCLDPAGVGTRGLVVTDAADPAPELQLLHGQSVTELSFDLSMTPVGQLRDGEQTLTGDGRCYQLSSVPRQHMATGDNSITSSSSLQ